MRILVTGANGFVGSALSEKLCQDSSITVRQAVRRNRAADGGQFIVGEIDGVTNWREAVQDCDVVIHLAARVHVMNDKSTDPLQEYRRTNLFGTLNLAKQAATAGVKRFVFVSTVKVNGERSNAPFKYDDPANPIDHYGQSKYEAENALISMCAVSGIELVIVRPPLVYGPGVQANFFNLIRLVHSGVPLPLGKAHSLRSMISIENLVDFLKTCAIHPDAPGNLFLISDGNDVSVRELTLLIADSMNKSIFMIPVPPLLMKFAASCTGKRNAVSRLFDPLQVDISLAQERLDWRPVISVREGIKQTVRNFLTMDAHQ